MYSIRQDDLYYHNNNSSIYEKGLEKQKKMINLRRKAFICATFMMWGASCFLSFAIGYRYQEDNLCNCSTIGREL
jgi:hypothetical protein